MLWVVGVFGILGFVFIVLFCYAMQRRCADCEHACWLHGINGPCRGCRCVVFVDRSPFFQFMASGWKRK